jgi:hypothetical protein
MLKYMSDSLGIPDTPGFGCSATPLSPQLVNAMLWDTALAWWCRNSEQMPEAIYAFARQHDVLRLAMMAPAYRLLPAITEHDVRPPLL